MNHRINITFQVFSLVKPFICAMIRKSIQAALSAERVEVPCEINVLITDNDGIRAINKASRNIDQSTDVLSFPMFQLEPGCFDSQDESILDPETMTCPLGDMCISLEKATSQALEFGHSVRREVCYLTIHSVLHLLGYDHLDEGPKKAKMRKREEEIAAMIGATRK